MHPAARGFFAGDRSGNAGPPRIDSGQGQSPILVVAFAVCTREALSEVLLIAGRYFMLNKADNIGECEGLLADAAGKDVLVVVDSGAVCVCCNKHPP